MSAASDTTNAPAPLVSVVLPVFNGGDLLERSIRSVLDQTHSELELIVVDDGSTDGSAERAAATGDPRVRVIANTVNRGQTHGLIQGIAVARGDLVARQDADDLSHPDRLRLQVAALSANPDVVLVGTCGWMVDGAGRACGTLDLPVTDAGIGWAMLFGNPFLHSSVMFRAQAAQAAGGYDTGFRICQDYDLWSRLLAKGRGLNLPGRLLRYRYTAQSLSHANRDTVRDETRRVIARETRARLPALPLAESDLELLTRFATATDLAPADLARFQKLRSRMLAAWQAVGQGRERGADGLRRALALQDFRMAFLAFARRSPSGFAAAARAFLRDPSVVGGKLRAYLAPDPTVA
jgi:hypothetical protein